MDKKPSLEWKDYLHDKKSLTKAAIDSFELYKIKYEKLDIINNPRKEKIVKKFFIPGKIYTFLYATQDTPNKKRPYINRRPVIISLGQMLSTNKKIYEVGIDLMLVPPKIRVFIFDQIYHYYKNDINKNESNINEGKKGVKALKINYEISKKLFNKLGWQMAFSVFEKRNIVKPAIYDYEDWISIIPLYTRGIVGKQLKDILSDYIKKITNPPDIDVNEKMKTNADRKKDEFNKQQSIFKKTVTKIKNLLN